MTVTYRDGRTATYLRRLAVVAVLGVMAACARQSQVADENEGPPEPVVLVFKNESLDQADVYAIGSSGNSTRIGTVMAGRTENLVVPREMVANGSVSLVARLLSKSAMVRSGPVAIHAGDELVVTLPMSARMLTVIPAP